MIEITDPEALKILQKQYSFGLGKDEDEIFTPGFAIISKKGYGSTTFTMTNFPGSQLIFSYDGQSEVIRQELAKKDKTILDRIKVIDLFSPVFKEVQNDDRLLLEVGYKICDYVLQLLPNIKADHIVHERLPILNQRVEKYARYLHFGDYKESLTAPILGNNLRMWGFRNRFYEQLIALTFSQSNICPVITTYPAKNYGDAFKGQQNEDPEWEINIMAHFRNIVSIKRVRDPKKPKGLSYWAVLDSMKGTDFGETGEEFDITGFKVIFPPEKFEVYRKGNPFNKVKSPITPELSNEKTKDPDTIKENLDHKIEESKENILGDFL